MYWLEQLVFYLFLVYYWIMQLACIFVFENCNCIMHFNEVWNLKKCIFGFKTLLYFKNRENIEYNFWHATLSSAWLNQNGTHRGCLLEAVGGWDNLWNLLYDLLMGFLEPKQSSILANFVFQDRQKDFFWVEVNQVWGPGHHFVGTNYFEKSFFRFSFSIYRWWWLSYSWLLWDCFKNRPTVVRTLQLAILGVTTILVASRSDFRVLWGVRCYFPLEIEDIATFCSFKPPWVLVER